MSRQSFAGAFVAIAMASWPALAQSGKTWAPPRGPDGHPDIEGIWTNSTLTPFERPKEFEGKAFLTREEAAALEKRMIEQRNADRRDGNSDTDLARAYNDTWFDWGTKVAKTMQTSLVVDPPDGRLPPYTPEAQKRIAARAQATKERCEHTVCMPSVFDLLPADGPEDRSLMDRCIVFPEAPVPMLPGAYNNNYQIVQSPGYVTIRLEMIHDVRVIPLDGRPHLPPNIRQWLGDPRGHWEGNTLVVETTNFTDRTRFRNSTGNMRLTERFTRTDPDTLVYEFTVDDPATFTRPWTASIPMNKTKGPLFEYACHEGNYGMTGILSADSSPGKSPLIITLEEHMTTPDIVKAAPMAGGGGPPAFMEAIQAKLLDVGEGRIADMDAAGIDMQVLSVSANTMDKLDSATANALARDANERMAAAVRAHPNRLAAFANLALQEPDKAAVELDRCIRQLGFKGVMLNGTANGQFLDHPRFTPVFEAAQALDVPIYLHPAPPPKPVMEAYYSGLPGPLGFFLSTAGWGWHAETGMHCLRLILAGVFDRFPGLKIIIGHMGENLPFSIARSEAVFGRGVAEYFCKHFYLTTSGYFTTPPFLCMQQVVGIDRIMFSVDYPFSPNTRGRKFLDSLAISPEDMERITHRNAEKLLKL